MNYYYEILKNKFGLKGHCAYSASLYEKIAKDAEAFIFPGLIPGTGPFPLSRSRIIHKGKIFDISKFDSADSHPEFFRNPEEAYAVLNLSLAVQTTVMLKNVGLHEGMTVYIEGGFRKNNAYNILLSALLPGVSVVLSDMVEATSIGAAVLALSALENAEPKKMAEAINIITEPVKGSGDLQGLDNYCKRFFELIETD